MDKERKVIIGGLDKKEALMLSEILLNHDKSFKVDYDSDSDIDGEKPFLISTGAEDGFFFIDEE